MSQYIPDITERFPEGYGGVDKTEDYFYDDYRDYSESEEHEEDEDDTCNGETVEDWERQITEEKANDLDE